MSGHSKWSTIKHKKAATDAKRGKIFTRLIKELTVAAKLGGGDEGSNPRLRTAVAAAKAANMPNDNIKRAIQKGTGELPGVTYEEVTYEGYGPGGVAVLIETLTDNRMRTTPEVRHLFSKFGGNLGEQNSVSYLFEKKGNIRVERSAVDEDRLLEIALEAGADDMEQDDEGYTVQTSAESFQAVVTALEQATIPTAEASIVMVPVTTVELEGKKAQQCLKLLELFQDHDDVQNVYANLEVDESELESGVA